MDPTFGLIACSKTKRGKSEQDRKFKANRLYDSWLFNRRMNAVKEHCEEWAVMSAKHGLLMPDDKVSWYDKEISELSTDEKEQLVSDVVDSLPNDIDGLMILMGREYADPLKEKLPDDIEVWDPLEGMTSSPA